MIGAPFFYVLDYGGQQEIVDATKRIIADSYKSDDVTPELISKYLYAPDIPTPDLIIRTSGEQRLSNFLLWESAYSELIFSKVYWPDFTEQDLSKAIAEYATKATEIWFVMAVFLLILGLSVAVVCLGDCP